LVVFIFNSELQQCNDLTWKTQGFRLLTATKSVVYVIEMCCYLLLTAKIHDNSVGYFSLCTNKKQFSME
jgi:hypothetical protein